MNTVVVYVYAGRRYDEYAMRFVETYAQHPALAEHTCVVACNTVKASGYEHMLFSPLQNVQFYNHDNTGFDLGAFQAVSRSIPSADMMLFCGASSFFQRAGWLRRAVDAFDKHGDGMYGSMANRGDLAVVVYPHIRTTGFWMSPKLFNAYPETVKTREQRYPFEHGEGNLTIWAMSQKKPALVVSFDSEYAWRNWDDVPNGFQKGDQSNILIRDKHTEPPIWYGEHNKPKPAVASPAVQQAPHRRILPQSVLFRHAARVQLNRV